MTEYYWSADCSISFIHHSTRDNVYLMDTELKARVSPRC